MTNYNQRAKEIVNRINYATIATASKAGKPWNTPVYAIHDSNLNIYWFSDRHNQHSQNIRENEDVFIVIYDSTVSEGDGEGVYIEAKAIELSNPSEIRHARSIKKGTDKDAPDDFLVNAVRRAYKATPQFIWTNEAEIRDGKFIRDYRVEVSLDELKRLLAEN